MCEPTTIAVGAALLAAGAYEQNEGVKKADRAVTNVRRAEDIRQKKYAEQAQGAFGKNMETAKRAHVDEGQQQAAKSREKAYQVQQMAAPHVSQQLAQGEQGGNKIVADSLGEALSKAHERTGKIGAARAQLGGLDDSLFNTRLLLGRGSQKIGEIADLARGSMKPVAAEVGSAQHAGDNAKSLGQLLQLAGSLYLGGAGAAAGAGAGGMAGAASAGSTAAGAGIGGSVTPGWLATAAATG